MGGPALEVTSRYSRDVNCPVAGHQCTERTILGRTCKGALGTQPLAGGPSCAAAAAPHPYAGEEGATAARAGCPAIASRAAPLRTRVQRVTMPCRLTSLDRNCRGQAKGAGREACLGAAGQCVKQEKSSAAGQHQLEQRQGATGSVAWRAGSALHQPMAAPSCAPRASEVSWRGEVVWWPNSPVKAKCTRCDSSSSCGGSGSGRRAGHALTPPSRSQANQA